VTRPRPWWPIVAGLGLASLGAVLFGPALAWLVGSWRVHPYYSHGFLLPPIAAWFAWRARAGLTGGRPSDAGLALVSAGLGLHLVAAPWQAHPISIAGLFVVLLGLALLAGGPGALRAAAFPVSLLALAVPLPMVERLAPPLAGAVAHGAALAAGALGVGVVRAGAQLAVGGGAFTVGAPCSGLNSLVALATLGVVLAGTVDAAPWRRLAVVGLAVPLALAANWVRLTGLLWVAGAFGAEAGLAVYHGPASPLLFLVATALLVRGGRALGCDVRPG